VADDSRRTTLTPGIAWAIPAAFLGLLLPARASVALDYGNGAVGACLAVALFALPLLYTVPAGRAVWNRHTWSLLAVQAVLTYLPFLIFGKTWVVGLSGLLGGLVLLAVRAPLSWLLFVAIIAIEGVLRIGVLGIYPAPGAQYYSWVFVVPIDMGLPLFGLVRLSDLVADLNTARTELAGLAVASERRQSTARLRTAVGDRLEAVAERCRAALAALAESPDRARRQLVEAADLARQAVEHVRQTAAEDRTALPGRRRPADTVAPRLALLVLVVDLGAFSIHHAMIVADSPGTARLKAAALAAIVAIAALQMYHSLAARPRAWRATLPAQALLPFTDYVNLTLLGLPGFPAGSALLLLRGWRAWVAFALITPSMAVFYWMTMGPGDVDGVLYLIGVSASTGLAVYGLSRLRDLAEELESTRREIARTAVERERLRVAQDTHDLLGLGLSAVALKCDLGVRLIGRDDARANRELQALVRLAAQARADVRAVTTGEHELSLHTELAAAREVLATAGVHVDVEAETAEAGPEPLPAEIDRVLATVLREAVTNVLRHAEATRCEVALTRAEPGVRLTVANDGAVPDGGRGPDRRVGGHGLANLAARAAALGGRLTVHTEDGRFELTVEIPLPAGTSEREDAFTPRDPAHGVDDVVGRAVLGEEP
jgi:two-component system, NarL family, sensor histidine kinase DesK